MKTTSELLHHEALDRASILLDNLERLLGEHPVIEADQNFKYLYDAAFNNLHQLYQKLGE
ncbi:hypothetical protein HR060_11690 [Catenovulum sp. SM1970]|uniref:hypothetical protein n=1 Tax=Marinifaba aquimaris TaxID=2741323 RepID=UPI0015719042|nr:hypothetical protein [Marinifaba aquimaris]NTS77525.1 hypothetical protein [Marinifaba aquimaris]